MVATCPSDNSADIDQTSFWDSGNLNWDAHRIGWAIAGACTAATVLISFFSVLGHCRNYTNRSQQRQILRILYMPPVYAVISFLSYRFFRDYTYYSLIQVVYEALTISAFLLLLIDYVAESAHGHKAENAIARKDKKRMLFPLCCFRFRPTKAYFMYTVKWAVLQYVIVRPAVSIAGIITQALNILCESEGFNVHFANVYLEAVDFVSISIALYGLLLFYSLTKDELVGRRPLSKFLAIKLIVMFTWYQSFVLSALSDRVLKATKYWTVTNIADGLNALAVCIEMIFFSGFMMWAFTWNEYKRKPGTPATSIWRPLWDSINYADFALEIFGSLRFFMCGASAQEVAAVDRKRVDFGRAFGVGHPQKGSKLRKPRSESASD
ncbi:organic solute transporter Ostalpha-domain-containing protein [Mycena albidolilacea]|uniref:Organic solute transporter Ostalpha-domain-containing protein n=1 Tax=Mycena albidolilacea TaxID=1033008 RepID=A0AAD7EQS3_9AGAR|nr:organic solute transporter Ostalpha-domain-containing protein [Mycena albidolilacea]